MRAASLNEGERLYLNSQLQERTTKIQEALSSLKQACRRWMKENVSFEQLRDVLHDVDGINNIKMFDDWKDIMDSAKDHGALIDIIYRYTSWYNYGLFKHVVTLCADKAMSCKEGIEDMFKSYESELLQIYRQFVFECPPPSDEKSNKKSKYYVLKIDIKFEKLTLGDLHDHIQHPLQKILGIGAHVLHLRLVRDGCTELVYLLPKCVYEAVFPLSEQKLKQLSELGVMTIYIDTRSQVSLFS